MGTVGFLALAGFFAYLAFDSLQFERTSRHRAWAAPPPGRAIGEDPLSRSAQEAAQANKFTAIGGIPGLFWVFVVLAVGCLVAAFWSYIASAA